MKWIHQWILTYLRGTGLAPFFYLTHYHEPPPKDLISPHKPPAVGRNKSHKKGKQRKPFWIRHVTSAGPTVASQYQSYPPLWHQTTAPLLPAHHANHLSTGSGVSGSLVPVGVGAATVSRDLLASGTAHVHRSPSTVNAPLGVYLVVAQTLQEQIYCHRR